MRELMIIVSPVLTLSLHSKLVAVVDTDAGTGKSYAPLIVSIALFVVAAASIWWGVRMSRKIEHPDTADDGVKPDTEKS